jgi:hypothetical protein
MSEKTYVYEDIEVKLTGRVATRQGKRAVSRSEAKAIETLYEIEPVDPLVKWLKWVRIDQLFEIEPPK